MIRGIRKSQWLLATTVIFALALSACVLPGADTGQIAVVIDSPSSGDMVTVNEAVTVQATASDPDGPGIDRIEMLVDGVLADTATTPGPQPLVGAQLSFIPTVEGAISIIVIAYRADGTASNAATIALSVVGQSAVPEAAQQEAADAPAESEPAEQFVSGVTGQANVGVIVRERPGPFCPEISVVLEGEVIQFFEVTTSQFDYWYKVPVEKRVSSPADLTTPAEVPQYGWVFQGDPSQNFTLLQPDDELPRVNELGCLGCGDGVCSPEIGEACDVCVADCGVCPFCGDGAVNQSSEQCDGGGCSQDQFCNTSCQCETPQPVCGNGIVEAGETCDSGGSNGSCGSCDPTCSFIIIC